MHGIEFYGVLCIAVEVHRPLKWAHLRGVTAIWMHPGCAMPFFGKSLPKRSTTTFFANFNIRLG